MCCNILYLYNVIVLCMKWLSCDFLFVNKVVVLFNFVFRFLMFGFIVLIDFNLVKKVLFFVFFDSELNLFLYFIFKVLNFLFEFKVFDG